jgi:hypothetical protein
MKRKNRLIHDTLLAKSRHQESLEAIQIHVQTREGGAIGCQHQAANGTFDITKNVQGATPDDCQR